MSCLWVSQCAYWNLPVEGEGEYSTANLFLWHYLGLLLREMTTFCSHGDASEKFSFIKKTVTSVYFGKWQMQIKSYLVWQPPSAQGSIFFLPRKKPTARSLLLKGWKKQFLRPEPPFLPQPASCRVVTVPWAGFMHTSSELLCTAEFWQVLNLI